MRDDPPPPLSREQVREAVRLIATWEASDRLPEELVRELLPILGRPRDSSSPEDEEQQSDRRGTRQPPSQDEQRLPSVLDSASR